MQHPPRHHRLLSCFFMLTLMAGSMDLVAEIRIGMSSTADAENSGVYVWVRTFADELERGGITSTIYPSSTLGSEIVRTEQVLLGLLEVNVTGTQEIEIYSELITALDLPFLFKTNLESDALFHATGYREEINRITTQHGMRVVALPSIGGMTGVFTARTPIQTVKDVSKFRMRAMVADQIEWVESWGGAATQVAWEEVPQALQTGIVDGYINPPIIAVMFGHGGQLDYFTDLSMSPSVRVVVFSELWYQGLSPAQRAVVDHAAELARQANLAWTAQAVQREIELLNSIGIEVIKPSEQEREGFRTPLLPSYQKMVNAQSLEQINRYMQEARAWLATNPGGGVP